MPRVLIYNNFRLDRNNRMAGMMMKMMNPMGSMPVSRHSIRAQYGGDNHFPSLKNIISLTNRMTLTLHKVYFVVKRTTIYNTLDNITFSENLFSYFNERAFNVRGLVLSR